MTKVELDVEMLRGPAAWLDRWAAHVGGCRGDGACTCGLVLARAEMHTAIQDATVTELQPTPTDE